MHRFGIRTPDSVHRAIYGEIERLEKLAADLTVMNTAPFPTNQLVDKACMDAPILEDWRYAMRPVPCLVGISSGHPVLAGDARSIVTSEVWLISEELCCARSYSRWYRLGRRSDDQSSDS
ncbi:DUF6634 family protein [Chelativorans salis]|uniref:Uncharacterized protein n=1 Tax=Chelativorans salis TaxID=2978478 RepID=A0ABT2LR99_9HYPH|nr:DUF6634 family protein [Chelativorans sp. EGI FJ00035]MCT7375888.1 hypothetical protein [Chelativorans sp. EGI FJ00035]